MSVAEAAEGRSAGHGAERFAREADQSDGRAHARGGCRGLRAGVAAADDNDVELSRHGWAFNERAPLCHDGAASVPRETLHLPMQNVPNSASSISSTPARPVMRSRTAREIGRDHV